MARGRGGSGRGRGGRGGSSSSCDISGAYNSAVIALNVIFMLTILAIGAFSWWKKKRMSAEAKVKSPLRWHNFLLSLLFVAFGYLLNWALTAAALCGNLDNPGDVIAASWFLSIGFLILVWTILIPTLQTFWIHSGGNFKFIKFGYFGVFGLLVILTIVNLGIATDLNNGTFDSYEDFYDLQDTNYKIVTAISFIWFFTTISVGALLFLSLLGMKKNNMPLGKLIIWVPGFVVSLVVSALIPCIIYPTYYLGSNTDDYLTEGKLIAQLFFSLLFTTLTYFFLLMLGTSSALGNDSATHNPLLNLGGNKGGPGSSNDYKPEAGAARSLPTQQPAYQHPPNTQSPPPQPYAPETQYQSPQQQYAYHTGTSEAVKA